MFAKLEYKIRKFFKRSQLQIVQGFDTFRIIFIKLPRSLFIHLGKLRTGNHRFPCERGRWQGLGINEKKCTLCNCLEVGDEFHYLLYIVCSFFSSERKRFIEKRYHSDPNTLKYKELMNYADERRLKDLCVCQNTD